MTREADTPLDVSPARPGPTATTQAKVRVGVATGLVGPVTGFAAAWLLNLSTWVSMAFNTAWLITVAAVATPIVVYYAVRATGRGGLGAKAARASCGFVIAAATIPVVATLLNQPYAADTMTIMWLEGLLLRGVVPIEVAKIPCLALMFVGGVVGMVWGARAWREQQIAFEAMGENAPRRLVSRNQVIGGAIAVAAGIAAYRFVPGVQAWVDQAVEVLLSGDIEYVRDYLLSFGAWAPVVSALLMILQSIAAPIPAFVVTFTNGLLFGWFWGALLSWSSAMAGAALCFWIARALGRPVVERLAGGSTALEVSDLFFKRFGDRAVLIARLLPFVSFDIISYGAGLTSINFRRFFIATGLGQLPATIVYSYLGQNLTGSVRVLFLIFLFTIVVFVIAATARPFFMHKIKKEVAEEHGDPAESPA
ncbi:MAG: hypothetical protein Kow0067_12540 [Coriobacteriia bacterium]